MRDRLVTTGMSWNLAGPIVAKPFCHPKKARQNISSLTRTVSDYGAECTVTAPKLLSHN